MVSPQVARGRLKDTNCRPRTVPVKFLVQCNEWTNDLSEVQFDYSVYQLHCRKKDISLLRFRIFRSHNVIIIWIFLAFLADILSCSLLPRLVLQNIKYV